MEVVRRTRAILTEQQAVEIFKWQSTDEILTMVCRSSFIAKKFGISEKTVRDIWKQRTWAHATCSLGGKTDTATKVEKKIGRPKGSKDSRPRKQKQTSGTRISPASSAQPLICNVNMSFYEFDKNDELQQDSLDTSQPQSEKRIPGPTGPLLGTLTRQHVLPIEEESIDDQLYSWTFHDSHWIEYAQTTHQID